MGFNSESMHAYHIYWPGKNSISVECNVKFALAAPHIALPLLPEGEQQLATPNVSAPTQVSQQGDASPSVINNTTKVDPTSATPKMLHSTISTPMHLTTHSMA